jgi:hypothetical protein
MSKDPKQGQNQAAPRANSAYEEEQRGVRERNDEARRAGKKERDDNDRRAAAAQRARDLRDHVYR